MITMNTRCGIKSLLGFLCTSQSLVAFSQRMGKGAAWEFCGCEVLNGAQTPWRCTLLWLPIDRLRKFGGPAVLQPILFRAICSYLFALLFASVNTKAASCEAIASTQGSPCEQFCKVLGKAVVTPLF